MALEKKLINVQFVRFGALTVVLLLSTVMLITINESQNSVFAQNITSKVLPSHLPAQDSTATPTTPAPEPSGSASQQDASSSDGDDSDSQQGAFSSEEEDETKDDIEQKNQLLEQIRKSVNGALSATGIAVP